MISRAPTGSRDRTVTSRWLGGACALLLGAAFACGPKVRVDGAPPTYELDDPSLAVPAGDTNPGEQGNATAAPPVKAELGSVRRAQLLKELDKGPAAFLAGVQLEPYFREERFAGWEIVKFWPGDPRFAAVDLQPGDVVTAVNGHEIMKPQNLFEVWSQLREATVIVVTGQRANTRFELRFQVVDEP